MSTMIQTALQWKLAIFQCFVGVFVIMGTTLTASLTEADIMSPHAAKVTIFWVSVAVVGFKAIDMFINTTVNNLRKSSSPLGFDTAQITKQDVTQVTVETPKQ